MPVVLASAWYPRGELARFLQARQLLSEVYASLAIALPPQVDVGHLEALQSLPEIRTVVTPEWSWGRYSALREAVGLSPGHVHYADFDRLLRWVEVNPGEWRQTVAEIQKVDCLIVGRTEAAYQTHPKALVQTEAISNLVASYLLGLNADVSAGSKGFSRRAAEFILAHCRPGMALGTDAEWPVILHRGGYEVRALAVDGLEWESADRYQDQAASPQDQRRAAEAYDADPANWESRVAVALEIVQSGIQAASRGISNQAG